jgi:hypothetical protein
MAADVSEKYIAFNISVHQSYKVYCCRNVDPEEGITSLRNVVSYVHVDRE